MASGGSVYWGPKCRESRGVVVLFGWVSITENQLRSFAELYSSLGWNSLICHAGFLSALYHEKGTSLAFFVLNELLEELNIKPCPVVFAVFSAGSNACLDKVLHVIDRSSQAHLNWDSYRLVRYCVSGIVFDSSPVDITNDLGSRFLHGSIFSNPGPSKVVSWIAKGISSGLDALYLTKFESQRAQYWKILHSSVHMGAPYLMVCSEDDSLAPYQTICSFAQSLQGLGADVRILKSSGSAHIGHYMSCPNQYRDAMATFLVTAASSVFSRKLQQLEEERMEDPHDEISQLIWDLQNAAVGSNQCLRRITSAPGDQFFFSNSMYDSGSPAEMGKGEASSSNINLLQSPPTISANSLLGQMLYDVCVPKNVEGWDMKFTGSLNCQPHDFSRKLSPSGSSKSIRRSRL
ncbi:hypothetical protein SAY86_001380 [Trapa natans]|uniref:Uncharacterized protein n=1 Tax=Trapa natans TaxID=22666 RepID=A0AAN7RGF8_TRANT|nr:hypothetical protein SAY86_001380 [Trapa natans]